MKKHNVALINPPSPFLINDRVFPNLGLLQVATSYKEQGHNVSLIDLCGVENSKEIISKIANEYDFFGFSSTTSQFIETYSLLETLKESNPNAKTFIGGSHASAVSSLRKIPSLDNKLDSNISSIENFDVIIEGDGENSYAELLKGGEKGRKKDLIKNIDESPIPNRSLIDILSYKYSLDGKPTTTIMTQRGCPFKCKFCCGRDIDMYRISRRHSPERVLKELDYLNSEFGYEAFMWFDDEVNLDTKRIFELSKLLEKRHYIHRGFVRSNLVRKFPDTIKALKDSGFVELCSGAESGSDKILKEINKGATLEDNLKASELIKREGIRYKSFTIIGHPGETIEDIESTKELIRKTSPDSFDVSILTPYPGSTLYNLAITSRKHEGYGWEYNGLYFNKIDYSKDNSFYKGRIGEYSCEIRTDELTSEYLLKIRDEMEIDLKKELYGEEGKND